MDFFLDLPATTTLKFAPASRGHGNYKKSKKVNFVWQVTHENVKLSQKWRKYNKIPHNKFPAAETFLLAPQHPHVLIGQLESSGGVKLVTHAAGLCQREFSHILNKIPGTVFLHFPSRLAD